MAAYWCPTTVCLLVALGHVAWAELSCKDMNGKDVDWFVTLKIPKLSGKEFVSKSPHIAKGTAFYYADANNQEFVISAKDINDPSSAMGYTISQAIDVHYKKAKDTFYIFYNDQHPGTVTVGSRAHAKGVSAFNAKQGFWLVHSAPRFSDPTKGKYFYPETATKFGQSFFCGTYDSASQLEEISRQMYTNRLSIYAKGLPDALKAKYPRLENVLNEDTVDKGCPQFRNTVLKTKGGTSLRSYAKTMKWGGDLYSNLVATDLNKGLKVETWLNGANPDYKNTCDKQRVQNLRRISPGGVTWSSALDHSKWAITIEPGFVCIGDINRQKSQAIRGGGTTCIQNRKIWDFFNAGAQYMECCKGDKECEAEPSNSVPAVMSS